MICNAECSYHLAEKKIPSVNGYTMGFKLEQFIFDAFPYAPSTALFEVCSLRFSNFTYLGIDPTIVDDFHLFM